MDARSAGAVGVDDVDPLAVPAGKAQDVKDTATTPKKKAEKKAEEPKADAAEAPAAEAEAEKSEA